MTSTLTTEIVNHKSIVPEPEQFNRDRKTFEYQWRTMKLYLEVKKIIAVLGRFKGETIGAFAQQKLNKIDKEDNIPSQDAFKVEL